MTVRRIKKTMLRLSCLFLLITGATGCIGEYMTDCGDNYLLTVKAYDHSGNELGTNDVREVSLFIFDEQACFIRKLETTIGSSVAITAPTGEYLHIVAWGNLNDGTQSFTQPGPGELSDDCFVTLTSRFRSVSYVESPGDLFRGGITLTPQDKGIEKVLPVYRETGSMAITIRGLKTFTGFDDANYSVVVRETYSSIGFNGTHSGEKVAYLSQGSFTNGGGREEYSVPSFNLIPEERLYIDIFHGEQLVATISSDNAKNPITVEKGLLTNVLIDLKTSVSVSIALTDWGDLKVWKEF